MVGMNDATAQEPERDGQAAAVMTSLTTGTMVVTREGELPVEWLQSGDEILTRDGRFQPILWLGRVRFNRVEFRYLPEFTPVRIAPGTLGDGLPHHDVTVSPSQLVLYRSVRAELEYWSSEVLVPASSIGTRIDTELLGWHERVGYTQILLPAHHLMAVEGVWLGSLFLADMPAEAKPNETMIRAGLKRRAMQSARPILAEDEARALILADRRAAATDEDAPATPRSASR